MSRNRKAPLGILSIAVLVITLLVACGSALAQGTTQYVYDENGRLKAVISANGETTIYTYDAAGNIVSVRRQQTPLVTISGFNPAAGLEGATVTVFGSGFSANPGDNTVSFNGTNATVTAASTSQLTTSVPVGATTGPITITNQNGTTVSRTNFVVRAPLEITTFEPLIGTPQTPVAISGNGFHPTPESNVVKFNGFPATVDAASDTEISTTVPSGATSGHISVTTPNGAAISNGDFFVPPFPYSAEQVDFTGRLTFGQAKAFSLTSFNRIALLVFDGTAGQKLRFATSNVSFGFGLVTLFDPAGQSLTQSFVGSTFGSFIFTIPSTGTYTIMVEPFGPGNITLTVTQIVDVVGTIIPGGPPVNLALAQPGQMGRLTFNGVADQRVSLTIVNSTFQFAEVVLTGPDGSFLASTFISASGGNGGGQPTLTAAAPGDAPGTGFIDTLTLPVAGTYTITLEAFGTLGNATFQLYNVTDLTSSITINGPPVPLTINTPGQNAKITFTGTAGQLLDLGLSSNTFPRVLISVSGPEGLIVPPTELGEPSPDPSPDLTLAAVGGGGSTPANGHVGIPHLPVDGTYTIEFDPLRGSTGDVVLTLTTVEDVTGSITVDGPPLTISTSVVGQKAHITFAGEANQRVFLSLSDVTISGSFVTILDPDGIIIDSQSVNTDGAAFDINNLPVTGSYTILIEPFSGNGGDMTLQAAATGSITIGGPQVSTIVNVAGVTPSYTFSAVEGDLLRVSTNEYSFLSGTLSILKPDGTVLVNDTLSGISTFTVPETGTYTLRIDPEGNTGLIRFQLRNASGCSCD